MWFSMHKFVGQLFYARCVEVHKRVEIMVLERISIRYCIEVELIVGFDEWQQFNLELYFEIYSIWTFNFEAYGYLKME